MARSDERSLSDLQEDAQRNRAEFVETVDQLRSKVADTVTDIRTRVSPDAIKAEASDYFRARAEDLVDKARRNPLQAAAIGLGVGYPLFGIVRSIPAPVLMVGAGPLSPRLQFCSKRVAEIGSRRLAEIGRGRGSDFRAARRRRRRDETKRPRRSGFGLRQPRLRTRGGLLRSGNFKRSNIQRRGHTGRRSEPGEGPRGQYC